MSAAGILSDLQRCAAQELRGFTSAAVEALVSAARGPSATERIDAALLGVPLEPDDEFCCCEDDADLAPDTGGAGDDRERAAECRRGHRGRRGGRRHKRRDVVNDTETEPDGTEAGSAAAGDPPG
jgi:hypothetical protein